jgi:hypothetical protein
MKLRLIILLFSISGIFAPATLIAQTVPGPINTQVIDTLDYFISDHLDQGLSGSHNHSQKVKGNVSWYVKWSADAYEVHTWDDQYIYLAEDHGWQYFQGYAFAPGKWMKRQMKIGESIVESGNKAYYFSIPSCDPIRADNLPYIMTLESHLPEYDLGGALGRQDVIVLKYDYSNQATQGNFERFYYSKEWGWVKWELYTKGNLVQISVFNQPHSQPLMPQENLSCTKGGTVIPQMSSLDSVGLRILSGLVVRAEGDTALYYINNKREREYICSTNNLKAYGVSTDNVMTVSVAELQSYPTLNYVRPSNSRQVYKLEGTIKRPVQGGYLKRNRVHDSDITVVDSANLRCYKTGNTLR